MTNRRTVLDAGERFGDWELDALAGGLERDVLYWYAERGSRYQAAEEASQ